MTVTGARRLEPGDVVLILAALLAPVLLAGCGPEHGLPGPPHAEAPAAPVEVRTVAAAAGPAGWTETPGTIEAARTASISSRLSASVEKVPVREGDRVRAGDLLVVLDSGDLRARLGSAEASGRAARAHAARIRALHGRDAATREELDDAEMRESAALAQVAEIRSQLSYAVIRAPFDGTIALRGVDPGDFAAPGRDLVTLHGSGPLRVATTIPSERAAMLAIGERLEAVLEDGSVVPAVVSVVSPASDPVSRRVLVKCDLPEPGAARAGSFARLRLPAAAASEPSIVVPESALLRRGSLTGLFVVQEGRARLRWVGAGEASGGRVVIRSGVVDGELVVVEPAGLSDGAPVIAAGAARAPLE